MSSPPACPASNQSSAQDLATLVNSGAWNDPRCANCPPRRATRWQWAIRTLQYNNTNRLVKNPDWEIGLQKTGYISEAGQCLVMQTKMAGRKLIMVFLDSAGKLSRLGDAERVRRWVESVATPPQPRLSGNARQRSGQRLSPATCSPARLRSRWRWPAAWAASQVVQPAAGAEIDRPATSLPWSS
jgi:D-alanyl-D-alanine endopeptidase (penicillin-binding protein 7)